MMKFTDILKSNIIGNTSDVTSSNNTDNTNISINLLEKKEKPEDILRKAKFKIKLITPTSFGVQIDFAKKYKDEDIENLLKDFTIKLKNKSVFIVN